MPRSTDYVLAPTERGAIDNLRLTETDVPPPAEGYVQVRWRPRASTSGMCSTCSASTRATRARSAATLAGIVTQLGSGVTGLEVGQRVYGFMQGAFSSRFNVPVLAPIPDGLSAVAAATIPAAALTARLAFDWAQLQPGDRVLIHAASGGVGLAAIQMAQQQGAIVFATASTYKRATLRKMGVKYVYDSRTTDFADQILADTDGAGVDVVLNSLTNEGFVEATVRPPPRTAGSPRSPSATSGHRSRWRRPVPISPTRSSRWTSPPCRSPSTSSVADRGVGRMATREWTPLPAEIYLLTEARAAFRRMQQARTSGRSCCRYRTAAATSRSELSDHRRTRCDRSAHGVVSGPTRGR